MAETVKVLSQNNLCCCYKPLETFLWLSHSKVPTGSNTIRQLILLSLYFSWSLNFFFGGGKRGNFVVILFLLVSQLFFDGGKGGNFVVTLFLLASQLFFDLRGEGAIFRCTWSKVALTQWVSTVNRYKKARKKIITACLQNCWIDFKFYYTITVCNGMAAGTNQARHLVEKSRNTHSTIFRKISWKTVTSKMNVGANTSIDPTEINGTRYYLYSFLSFGFNGLGTFYSN